MQFFPGEREGQFRDHSFIMTGEWAEWNVYGYKIFFDKFVKVRNIFKIFCIVRNSFYKLVKNCWIALSLWNILILEIECDPKMFDQICKRLFRTHTKDFENISYLYKFDEKYFVPIHIPLQAYTRH